MPRICGVCAAISANWSRPALDFISSTPMRNEKMLLHVRRRRVNRRQLVQAGDGVQLQHALPAQHADVVIQRVLPLALELELLGPVDRKSTRLNSSHLG